MKWKAVSLVPSGTALKNKWVCQTCDGKRCVMLLGIQFEPQKSDCQNFGGDDNETSG